ncbi:MAG: RNA polymerase factor sigma-32 [Deltaproteobacteria bacterium]|nr:RNA polymerase factor sigma-32 [Deltaproteobacteria bacterium]
MVEINRYPLLTREEETALAECYHQTGDIKAAHRLIVANLRFVVKICHEYSGYGISLIDLVQEGSIGLLHAVSKFDPSKGFRLISYAVWWIRAFIKDFIQHSWSLVKLGTTQAQRKLFFKLRFARVRADHDTGSNALASTNMLAKEFNINEREIVSMEERLTKRDSSLNTTIQTGLNLTHLDVLPAVGDSPEEQVSKKEEHQLFYNTAYRIIGMLDDRERYIFERRLMTTEKPKTLHEIGVHFKISRERVRQIEGTIRVKLHKAISNESTSNHLSFVTSEHPHYERD